MGRLRLYPRSQITGNAQVINLNIHNVICQFYLKKKAGEKKWRQVWNLVLFNSKTLCLGQWKYLFLSSVNSDNPVNSLWEVPKLGSRFGSRLCQVTACTTFQAPSLDPSMLRRSERKNNNLTSFKLLLLNKTRWKESVIIMFLLS